MIPGAAGSLRSPLPLATFWPRLPALPFWPRLPALPFCPRLPALPFWPRLLALRGLVTRGLGALSTLYRAHRCDGTLFVSGNGGDVLLFHLRQ